MTTNKQEPKWPIEIEIFLKIFNWLFLKINFYSLKLREATKNYFVVKAWRGEEKFWKVFLIGIITMIALLYVKSQWQAMMPFLLIVIIYPLFLISITRCRKNIDFLKNDPWFLYIINFIIVCFWIIYTAIFLFSIIAFIVSSISCQIGNSGRVTNSEFCVRFF